MRFMVNEPSQDEDGLLQARIPAGLPPCTEFVFKMSDQKGRIVEAFDGWLSESNRPLVGLRSLHFSDAEGRHWVRDSGGIERDRYGRMVGVPTGYFDITDGKRKAVETCEEYSGK